VLLGAFAFLENAIMLDESKVAEISNEIEEIMRIYYNVSTDISSDYEIGGSQDPFLQVTILRFLKEMRKHTNNNAFIRHFGEIIVYAHDGVNPRSSNLKNGAYAILFECFQCLLTVP
jgi:hypothetical protein